MMTKSSQRLLFVSALMFFICAMHLLLAGDDDNEHGQRYIPLIGRCTDGERAAWASEWNVTERNHGDLLDDRFTVALSTFHRPRELQRTLDVLLATKIPSLLEIVIIWNNLDIPPPVAFISTHGVAVRYRTPPRDSLNAKFWNDPSYRTRAVLLSDDDVFYRPRDLEFVFSMWRRFGRAQRITGALARCARVSPAGAWQYTFCSAGAPYALVLTNLAFVDVELLDAYHSPFAPVKNMRAYVDEHFNCEDIALNFVAAARGGGGVDAAEAGGPLLVRGAEQYVNLDPSGGISRQTGHMLARSACLNRFAEAFGCMPLVDEVARIEYGVKHNVWYKSIADRLQQ